MKKFLSMVLALVMTMSLVTVSAGAKEFTDDNTITYDEAIAVISTIGVVDGYEDGKFNPTNNLTRQAAAKIICNLVLGPTTASALVADTAPYPDVPTSNPMSGYIAYCAQQGIINGYPDGTFKPGNSLTGYAFMKMLLGALGYDSAIEGYTGDNWTVAVAKRALGIGLEDGLEGEFNGTKTVNREEACLYAFNTLQADLVEYDTKITTTVNGQTVTIGNDLATSRKWGTDSQRTRINNIREDDIIQFAEEYFRKLEKRHDWDDFMRPAYTWIYDRETIGTYVDWEVMVGEYTEAVSGRDIYDLLGSTIINDKDFVFAYYVDGVTYAAAPTQATKNGKGDINRATQLVRSYTEDLGITNNGVLTQVFLDKDRQEITITSINTWLAQATGDYQESKEYAPLNVYYDYSDSPYTHLTKNFNADVEDVSDVVDVKDEDWLLVNISYKDSATGNVVEIAEPEILTETTVTKFSTDKDKVVDKLTADGTEYKSAVRAYYDDETLQDYDHTLLTNKTYNVYLDPYGFAIGVELYEGDKDYVFITGFNRPNSNLSTGTADAAGIFLDGTMKTIKVDLKDTNDNIDAARNKAADNWEYFVRWDDRGLGANANIGDDGCYRLNRWYSYSVDKDGVYDLTPAVRMVARRYNANNGVISTSSDAYQAYTGANNQVYGDFTTLKTGSLSLQDNILNTNFYPYFPMANADSVGVVSYLASKYTNTITDRAYGNDDTVYLTVELGDVDTAANPRAITEVTGMYTGAQDVEIEFEEADTDVARSQEAQIYAVYDKNGYIIGAVTTGKVKGSGSNIAYITSGIKSERIEDGTYYWEFKAVVEGEEKTLTMKSKFGSNKTILEAESEYYKGKRAAALTGASVSGYNETWMNLRDGLVELRYDANGYVTDIKAVAEKDIISTYEDGRASIGGNSIKAGSDANRNMDLSKYDAYRLGVLNETFTTNATTYLASNHYDSSPDTLTLRGRTLYATADRSDGGLPLTADAKAVVVQKENGSWEVTNYSSVASAISSLADAYPAVDGFQYEGEIVAALNSSGAAKWVVFTNYTELVTGNNNSGFTGLNDIYAQGSYEGKDLGWYNAAPGTLTYALRGATSGTRYTVKLEMMLENGTWGEIDRWTVTGGGADLVGGTSEVYERTRVGGYTVGRQYRLVVSDYTDRVALR